MLFNIWLHCGKMMHKADKGSDLECGQQPSLYIFLFYYYSHYYYRYYYFNRWGFWGPDGKALLVQDSVQRRINPYADQTVSSTPMNATSTVATVVSVS